MSEPVHLTTDQLQAALPVLRLSPKDAGPLLLIARRPATDEREVLPEAQLTPDDGLVGDNWKQRPNRHTGQPNPDMQLNLMNARVAALVAQDPDRWALAGDQLYLDLDLSEDNLPPGARLALGAAVLEITAEPHTGCKKFSARFGLDASRFVNSPEGKRLNLRGVNAKVVQPGTIRVGDVARKLP
jgi:MOSC domain-containing protein YiiM